MSLINYQKLLIMIGIRDSFLRKKTCIARERVLKRKEEIITHIHGHILSDITSKSLIHLYKLSISNLVKSRAGNNPQISPHVPSSPITRGGCVIHF